MAKVTLTYGASADTSVDLSRPLTVLSNTVLGSAATTLASDTLPAKPFYKIIAIIPGRSTTVEVSFRFNGDTGNNYDYRVGINTTAFSNATSQPKLSVSTNGQSSAFFCEAMVMNETSSAIKGVFCKGLDVLTGGANHFDAVGTWNNTTNAITSITLLLDGTATLNSGTRLIILG